MTASVAAAAATISEGAAGVTACRETWARIPCAGAPGATHASAARDGTSSAPAEGWPGLTGLRGIPSLAFAHERRARSPSRRRLDGEIVALCKRRGFIFPSSEIYGGLGSTYDYGHSGSCSRTTSSRSGGTR